MRVRSGTKWAAASFLLALGASLILLVAPLGTAEEPISVGSSWSPSTVPRPETKVTHPSLLAIQGWSVAVPLSIPVALTLIGLVADRFRSRPALIGIAVLLGAFVVLGALSVGVFYLPAAVAMMVAAVRVRSA